MQLRVFQQSRAFRKPLIFRHFRASKMAKPYMKRPYFWLSVAATALLLLWMWMCSGRAARAPSLNAVSSDAASLACQQGAIAEWWVRETLDLVIYLMIYLTAIVLIWSHAFFWNHGAEVPPNK